MSIAEEYKKLYLRTKEMQKRKLVHEDYYGTILRRIELHVTTYGGASKGSFIAEWLYDKNFNDAPSGLKRKDLLPFVEFLKQHGFKAYVPRLQMKPLRIHWEIP